MRNSLSTILALALLFGLTSCVGTSDMLPGEIRSVHPGTALTLINECFKPTAGMSCVVFARQVGAETFYVFGKTSSALRGWVVTGSIPTNPNVDVLSKVNGNLMTAETFNAFKDSLIRDGWKVIPPSAVPPSLVSATSYALMLATSLPVLPMVVLPLPLLQDFSSWGVTND